MRKTINGNEIRFQQMSMRDFKAFSTKHDELEDTLEKGLLILSYSSNISRDELLDMPFREANKAIRYAYEVNGFVEPEDAEKNSEEAQPG